MRSLDESRGIVRDAAMQEAAKGSVFRGLRYTRYGGTTMFSGLEQTISRLGEATYRGRRWRFGIRQADRLGHTWVLGTTGTGKSTLLFNLMVQDLDCGRGFMLIDPHGALVEHAVDMPPPGRIHDTLY